MESYSNCKNNIQVIQVQNEYLEKCRKEQAQKQLDKSKRGGLEDEEEDQDEEDLYYEEEDEVQLDKFGNIIEKARPGAVEASRNLDEIDTDDGEAVPAVRNQDKIDQICQCCSVGIAMCSRVSAPMKSASSDNQGSAPPERSKDFAKMGFEEQKKAMEEIAKNLESNMNFYI